MAHAWYAPTYFSTFFSVAAEFILRVYVLQSHFVLNSRIHRRNAHHKRRAADIRAWRELPAQTLESKRPEVVSHSFFAHKRAFIHYSTRYNVSITLVFARLDLFGYPSLGSRDLTLERGVRAKPRGVGGRCGDYERKAPDYQAIVALMRAE
jgi:hypothetical protein